MEKILDDILKGKCKFGVTEVFSGKGILDNIPPTVSEIFADGSVCMIYDDGVLRYAEELAEKFKAAGYRLLIKRCAPSMEIPDYVRFVFGVGCGSVADAAKREAEKLEVDWALLYTAPTTDTILQGYAPKQVFIDENILVKCPNECVAAGWGIALSEPLAEFERYFAKKVLSESEEEKAAEHKLKELSFNCELSALAVKLLEIGFGKSSEDSAEIMARILKESAEKRGEKPRLMGEYKFLCSSVLTVFYSSFLGSPAIDVMPPCCHEELQDELEALTFMSRENIIKRFDNFSVNGYFKISYILGEYRMDLLEKLSGIDLHATQRYWRRLYPDAGYWLKGEFSARMLLKTLALAGEISPGLLGYAAAGGFTEIFRNAAPETEKQAVA